MELPEISKCVGVFPPRYGSVLISFFGLGTGGCGIAGIVMFAVVEEAIEAHFAKKAMKDNKTKTPIKKPKPKKKQQQQQEKKKLLDPMMKKVVLATIGLTSILLLVGNSFLFLGTVTSSAGCVATAKWVLLSMCTILLLEAMGGPLSCFFMQTTCVIKKFSTITMMLVYLIMTVFIEIWLYFMIVVHNFHMEL